MGNSKGNGVDIIKKHWAGAIAVALVLVAAIFIYYDKGNEVSVLIQSWGTMGVIVAVLLMAAIFMTPVPSEGLLIVYLKIYGVYFGTLYSWIGSIIGSLALFLFARFYGQNIMHKLITQERFIKVNAWVAEKGTFGLFVSRLLPIPSFFVNFVVGIMPSIKVWPYLWTAAISIIPYFVGMAMIFAGIAQVTLTCIILGLLIAIISVVVGYYYFKKKSYT